MVENKMERIKMETNKTMLLIMLGINRVPQNIKVLGFL